MVRYTKIKCCLCDKDDLTSSTARRGEYINETLRRKWVCLKCYRHDYWVKNEMELSRSMSKRRSGNLDSNSSQAIGDNFEELTCIWRSTISIISVQNLNKINDNYKSPIDHSIDSELGIIQTKGKLYGSKNEYWTTDCKKEYNSYMKGFKFDKLIFYCASKEGNNIDRMYIFPKEEILKRKCIGIYKNPTDCTGRSKVSWYDQYRILDKEIVKQINNIWKYVVEKNNKV